jgi:hypothetical protein
VNLADVVFEPTRPHALRQRRVGSMTDHSHSRVASVTEEVRLI